MSLEIRKEITIKGAELSEDPILYFDNIGPATSLAAITVDSFGSGNSGDMIFQTAQGGTLGEAMRIGQLGQVAIGTSSIDTSAVFQVDSLNRGFLPPRTPDPDTNITSPANGLISYDSTDDELQYYNGTSWVSLMGGGAGGDLATTLALGNITSGTNITTSDGDVINAANGSSALNLRDGGDGIFTLSNSSLANIYGSSTRIQASFGLNTGAMVISSSEASLNWNTGSSAITAISHGEVTAKPDTALSTISHPFIIGDNNATITHGPAVSVPQAVFINNADDVTFNAGITYSAAIATKGPVTVKSHFGTYVTRLALVNGVSDTFEGILGRDTLTSDQVWSLQDETGIIPVGPDWNTLIANPTGTEDTYVISWDNGSNEYTLVAQSGGAFLPLAGGTMTGTIDMVAESIAFNDPTTTYIQWDNSIGDYLRFANTGNDGFYFGDPALPNGVEISDSLIVIQSNVGNPSLRFENTTAVGTCTIRPETTTAARTITLPDETGTVALVGDDVATTGNTIPTITSVSRWNFTTNGTNTSTLNNGVQGQRILIVYAAEGAGTDSMVITPTTLHGYSTLTFNDIGDTVELKYDTTYGWSIISTFNTTIV